MNLLAFRFNSNINKIYTVKQNTNNVIDNDFDIPENEKPYQINIGAIVGGMSSGNLHAVGISNSSDISQIINDPLKLQEELDNFTNRLIEVVKSDLPPKKLITYIQSIEELKKQIQSEKPSHSLLQKLITNLSFLGDI